jgi:3-hydroxyacyl-[acyl-carrier-protein] dehydratase
MPPKPIVDFREFDLDQVEFGPEEIRARNPQRHEFELLHHVLAFRPEESLIIGDHYAKPDAFWVRGHIPGRPIMPGVLMIELAAQLCSFYWRAAFPDEKRFFGFGGIEHTRFRGEVVPADRLIVVGKSVQLKSRRAIFDAQGFVGDSMVYESRIIGLPI